MNPEFVRKAINRAAVRWCGDKERETSMDDIIYFKRNWSALPGLKKYVEEELAA